ncbi:tyrosine-type recombinase/integrase [Aliiglaciecola sp. LCG003]|uniref:tyrosine-type recombinase/integrase n=1 Tax=Aliiglaciecola sp. LCG003 TaxID=3053655 RepID=UPI0025739D1A|nr:tyrosine-type recombinase/integrase [Aliiglaciecola sp. LCG003]WJG09417.1 tyrosine-type recombinase/integrase [Aliiglaciecola sp. LCG003]
MSFSENVEVIPSQNGAGSSDQIATQEAKRLQKQKWWVLTATFLVIFVTAMIWIWSRAPIYQSQAIIHFSYAQALNNEQTAVPEEQITLNSKRLTSYRILEMLSLKLDEEYSLNLNPEMLAQMLFTEEQLSSRIINLYATGEQAEVLQPVLEQWLALYLSLLAEETEDNTEQDISLGQQKLIALEEKIIEQRLLVEQYSEDNNIISMERDENRALSKIKSMGAALDQAESQHAESTSTLNSVKQSIAKGEQVTHPVDKNRLDEVKKAIRDLEATLAQLAQRYTPEYMNLDPAIVNQKRNLDSLQNRLIEISAESQEKFVADLQRTVLASKDKQKQLEIQLNELGREAQLFNQKLEEYGRQTRSLKQLEEQAQQLKDQLVEKEVQKPFQAKINVLEAPFIPSYPIAPHYWRDTAIAGGAAVLMSLFALLLFSFIHRHKQPAATMTSYTVVPPTGLTFNQQAAQQALEQQQMAMLEQQNTPLQLGQAEAANAARLLSDFEVKELYKVANRDGKIVLHLLLSGVRTDELLALTVADVDSQTNTLLVNGEFPRSLRLKDDCAQLLIGLSLNQPPEKVLLSSRLDVQQLDQMMINMAHDAGLAYPEQFSMAALRHTYLTFLVSQGARLNDLEQVAGYVSPAELGLYRQVNRRGEPKDIDQLELQYSLV